MASATWMRCDCGDGDDDGDGDVAMDFSTVLFADHTTACL